MDWGVGGRLGRRVSREGDGGEGALRRFPKGALGVGTRGPPTHFDATPLAGPSGPLTFGLWGAPRCRW